VEEHVADHLERTVRTPDGRTLAVAEWGDPNGVPVIMLHGTPGSRLGHWRDPSIYARYGVRRITYDRAGYGRSSRLPGRCVADVVPDVTAIADALGIDRFVVTGGSGGGPHALAVGTLLGDRVIRCLAAVCPAPADADGLDWFAGMVEGNIEEFRRAQEGEASIRTLVERERLETFARLDRGDENFLGDAYPVSDTDLEMMQKDRSIFEATLRDGLRDGVDGWVDDDIAFVTPWGFDPASIAVPVSFWYGRADTLVPAAHGDWLVEHVPGAEAVVNDAGHMGNDVEIEQQFSWIMGGIAARA
jgi:pimeloyl-ACP methyl ester carboxylesterase